MISTKENILNLLKQEDILEHYLYWYAKKFSASTPAGSSIRMTWDEYRSHMQEHGLLDGSVTARNVQGVPSEERIVFHVDDDERDHDTVGALCKVFHNSTKLISSGSNVYSGAVIVATNELYYTFIVDMRIRGLNTDGKCLTPKAPAPNPEPDWVELAARRAFFAEAGDMTFGTPEQILGDAKVSAPVETNLTKEEEPTMNTTTQAVQTRRVVKITLMDNDAGIREASDALVKEWDGIVTQDDDATTIQELIMNKDVAGALKAHNTKRSTLVNRDILNRTGNGVKLEPVRLNELTWTVK